jgi:tripartite-type tricarboxylate transporter receptor subunit TctC
LSERLGQQFVMDNRPGAGGNIATEAVVRAPADGYTLLLATVSNAINARLYDKLNFNFIRDIAPVASLIRGPGKQINAGLTDARMKTRIADLGYQPYATSPAEFAKFINDETDKWAKIVKISGAKAE